MNVEHMPELHVWWPYPIIWLTMIGTSVGMVLFFRSKGWIGNGGSIVEAPEDQRD